jgi:hypothetical protein
MLLLILQIHQRQPSIQAPRETHSLSIKQPQKLLGSFDSSTRGFSHPTFTRSFLESCLQLPVFDFLSPDSPTTSLQIHLSTDFYHTPTHSSYPRRFAMATPGFNSSPEPVGPPSIEPLIRDHETFKILDARRTAFFDVSGIPLLTVELMLNFVGCNGANGASDECFEP